MKIFLSTLILLSIGLSNAAYAVENPKKNSFGDKDHKYRSQYTKSSNKTKIDNATKNGENSSPETRKSESSQNKPKKRRYVGH